MADRAMGVPQETAQPVARPTVSAGKARLLYIDNMRVGLITLVIVGHVAITYGAPIGDWPIAVSYPVVAPENIVYTIWTKMVSESLTLSRAP